MWETPIRLFCGSITALILFFSAIPVQAQSGPVFLVKPERFSVALSRGGSQEHIILIRNESDHELPFTLSVVPVELEDDSAPPRIGRDSRSAIRPEWITVDSRSFVLNPRDSRTINFRISLPESAPATDYVGGLIFRTESGSLIFEEGATILLDVFENGEEQIHISRFHPDFQLAIGNKTQFRYEIKNTGVIFAKPFGHMRILDYRGKEIRTIPIGTETILPGTSIEREVQADLPFGVYTAQLVLRYANDTRQATAESGISVLSRPVLFVLVLIIISVIVPLRKWRRTK
ncbi:MAG: hypothetical protein N2691_05675 [Patescibacteria group bacterium]|nr:hypothetical protein [Patescibacteria group bacterium]